MKNIFYLISISLNFSEDLCISLYTICNFFFLWMACSYRFLLDCLPFSKWLVIKFTLAYVLSLFLPVCLSHLALFWWFLPQVEVKILFSQVYQSFTLRFLILMSINRKVSSSPNTLKYSPISPVLPGLSLFFFFF